MTDWQKQLLNLCSMARMVVGNDDITRQEKIDLRNLANQVEAVVIREINSSILAANK